MWIGETLHSRRLGRQLAAAYSGRASPAMVTQVPTPAPDYGDFAADFAAKLARCGVVVAGQIV